jgi:hypothetical protein
MILTGNIDIIRVIEVSVYTRIIYMYLHIYSGG